MATASNALPVAPHQPSDCVVPDRLRAVFRLLQEKWAMFIVYVLMRGPTGFNEIARSAGDVNPTTLAQRLVRLEQNGLVKKTVQSVMPPRTIYELTQAGIALRPVLDAIEAWSRCHEIEMAGR
jgi:DNA-binding HxlR family transcriptional regulator